MLCKLKPGKRQVWLDWCNEIMTRYKDEAALSLVEEDLLREMCVVFGEGDNSFVVYRHQTLPGKVKKPFNPKRELNQEHFKKFHECLEKVDPQVLGYDIEAKT